MGDARLGVVRHRPAQLLEPDLLAGDRLDHVGAGDEHVRGLLDHEDEVGDRRRVHRAARARAHDQADLGDHARAADVAHEHVAVGAERDDALLDARAAGVVDADHRAADLGGEVHDLAHLLAHHLAERAAEHGEVLAEHAHGAPVDRAVPGHDRVAPGPVASACRSRRCGGARTCRAPGRSPRRAASPRARARCTCRARAASPRPPARSGSRPRAAPAAGRASPRRSPAPSGAAVALVPAAGAGQQRGVGLAVVGARGHRARDVIRDPHPGTHAPGAAGAARERLRSARTAGGAPRRGGRAPR